MKTPLRVLTFGAGCLREKAAPFSRGAAARASLIEDMLETLRAEGGVGLAAPQIGVSERIFIILLGNEPPRVFINPSIIETSEELCVKEEGCLSLPGVWEDVQRPRRLRVQAWNENGRPFTLEADGLLARALQHEYDHLDGILYIDRLTPVKRERLLAKYENQLKKNRRQADGGKRRTASGTRQADGGAAWADSGGK
jgi:peptide deformylase